MIAPLAGTSRPPRFGYAAALSLTLARLVLAVPLAAIAITRGSGRMAAIILVAGFLSDIYDGVVARRFGVATAGLRRLDSAVDTVFYLAAAACVWRLHPGAIVSHRWLIGAVVATLAVNHAVEYWKFRREASYHAWSAKAWGAALFTALGLLFLSGDDRLLPVALVIGLVSHLENFCITLALPRWEHDVRSVFAAWRIRRRDAALAVAGSPAQAGPTPNRPAPIADPERPRPRTFRT
ncbi:MAG TPA: CDP-alcohol phosphatidyltransferase family protein [Gemmatimonadaceae bacterium]|nr:CDP-alcohol phosphatidyltransferase family protein [Gemmatimonadaceae bacterium]